MKWKKAKEAFDKYFELSAKEQSEYLGNLKQDAPEIFQELLPLVDKGAETDKLKPFNENSFEQKLHPLQQIGAYQIVRKLGEGGMGKVFLGKRIGVNGFEKLFAIKSFGAEENLKKEAHILAKISHPNIVQVYEYLADEGEGYLVSEYIEGVTLRDFFTFPYKLKEAVFIYYELCQALRYLNEKNIIHRDIKPENIIISDSGTPKLIDFGIANELSLVGTKKYLAPEIKEEKSFTSVSDLYSLTLVFQELIQGKKIPIELEQVINQNLQKDPNHRFQSPSETLLALKGIYKKYPILGEEESLAELLKRKAEINIPKIEIENPIQEAHLEPKKENIFTKIKRFIK